MIHFPTKLLDPLVEFAVLFGEIVRGKHLVPSVAESARQGGHAFDGNRHDVGNGLANGAEEELRVPRKEDDRHAREDEHDHNDPSRTGPHKDRRPKPAVHTHSFLLRMNRRLGGGNTPQQGHLFKRFPYSQDDGGQRIINHDDRKRGFFSQPGIQSS